MASTSLAHIDEMFTNNRDPDEIFQALQKIYNKENDANSNNIEVQWRLAKACLQRGLNLSNERSADKDERRAILDQGVNWASKALSQNPRHFESLKYKCMLMGQIFDHKMGIKEKADRGLKLFNYLEKLAQMNPGHHEVLHMQGRLAYSVARLTGIERVAAVALFPKMAPMLKGASYEVAIGKLLQCEQTTRGTSIDNMFYLAKSYQKASNIARAKKCLVKVIRIRPINVYEQDLVNESRQTLAKLQR